MITTHDNHSEIKIIPKGPLKKDTDYELVFLKKANSALSDDEVHAFHTAPALILSGWKLLSNTQACIYSNNKIESRDDALATLSTLPASRTPTLSYDYGMDRWSSDGQNHTTVYVCPQVNGQNAYIVDLRLNPNLAYTMNFLPTLTDEYGQTLSKTVSYTSMTGPIAMKDRYLYSSAQ